MFGIACITSSHQLYQTLFVVIGISRVVTALPKYKKMVHSAHALPLIVVVTFTHTFFGVTRTSAASGDQQWCGCVYEGYKDVYAKSGALNSLSPGRCRRNFKNIFNLLYRIVFCEIASVEYHITLLMRNHYWLRTWLQAVRQQALSWANFNQGLCRHITSSVHQELNI